MIYLFKNLDNNASIVYDETSLTAKEKAQGKAFDKLPESEEVEGMTPILKFDGVQAWYEYVEKPVDELSRIEQLEQIVADLSELILGGI